MDRSSVISDKFGLPVRQRHLRNLRSILIRNICPKDAIKSTEDLCRYSFFFTLHEDCSSLAYYTSSKATGTLNPVWKKINFTKSVGSHSLSTSLISESVCIRVWMTEDCKEADDAEVIVRWDVNFSSLIPLDKEHLISGCNVILIEFDSGLYTAPFEDKVIIPLRTPEDNFSLQGLRMSYRLNSLKRLQLTVRAISEVKNKSEKVKAVISDILNKKRNIEGQQKEGIESMRCRLKTMRLELESRYEGLKIIENLCESQRSMNQIDDLALKEKYKKLKYSWELLQDKKKSYFDVRDQLIHTGAHLVRRRKQLLTDMTSIYPITKDSVREKYFIAGVHLPNSEELSGHDEIMLGVGLGFTCHLVTLISMFLDVPLRYPIEHRGSRSTIQDNIIDVLSDKERDFPLYAKGRERYQFEYAVYILNKNIVQLRHYCGMSTSGLGSTLFNLYTLLNDKLGVVKTTRSNAFASQHVIVPPSFGGPLPSSSSRTSTGASLAISSNDAALTSPSVLVTFNSTSTSSPPQTQSVNIVTPIVNIFSSVGNIPHFSSSVPTPSDASNSEATSLVRLNTSVTKLISTRSLSPSVESLTSRQEGGGFFRRKLKAFKLFRTSSTMSVNSSPSLSKCNSKFDLIESSELLHSEVCNSSDTNSSVIVLNKDMDSTENGHRSTVTHPNTSEFPVTDSSCTDTTLNEVISKLGDMLRVSENQNVTENLCPHLDLDISRMEGGVVARFENTVDAITPPCNGKEADDLPAVNVPLESSVAPTNLPVCIRSSPLIFRNLMTNTVETPDNCLSSEDELV